MAIGHLSRCSAWPGAGRAGGWLHVLELVDAALGVALADLAQRLVLVAALAHVLAVDLVHGGLLRLVARLRQVLLQRLRTQNRVRWPPSNRTMGTMSGCFSRYF